MFTGLCVHECVCVSKTEKYWLSVSKTGTGQEDLGLFDFDTLEGGVIEPMMMIIYASLPPQPFGQIVSYCFHPKMFTSQQANCCRRLQSFRFGHATSVFLFQTEEILKRRNLRRSAKEWPPIVRFKRFIFSPDDPFIASCHEKRTWARRSQGKENHKNRQNAIVERIRDRLLLKSDYVLLFF